MNMITSITADQDATRREIAARYGIAIELVAPVTVVPRGVSGLPMPWEDQGNWKQQRDAKRRIEKRIERVTSAKSEMHTRINARRDRAVELHGLGWYAHQIAVELGVAVTTAEDDLRKRGCKPHRQPYTHSRPEHLIRRDARIVALHKAGAHIGMIAEAEGCDIRAARKMCAQAGVKPAPVPRLAREVVTDGNPQATRRAERATLIATMAAEGRSREDIMVATGISDYSIREACRRLGIPLPAKAHGRAARNDAAITERHDRVKALAAKGMTYEQAADALGVNRLKAAKWAREAGVKFVREVKRKPIGETAEQVKRIEDVRRLYRSGMGFAAMQAELGLSTPKLRWAMHKIGAYKPIRKQRITDAGRAWLEARE